MSIMHESQTLEWKRDASSASFLKTVSAFANYSTGIIVFGINDDGSPAPIADMDGTKMSIEQKINDSVFPRPDFSLTSDYEAGTITLKVFEGRSKPYFWQGKAYKRSDTSSVEVDRTALTGLVFAGENRSEDERTYYSEGPLEFKKLSSVLKKSMGIESMTDDVLRSLELINRDGNYTLAAALLADENRFPGIELVCYGQTPNQIKQRKTVDRVSVLSQFEEAESFFREFCRYEEVSGFERTEKWAIPPEAFREVLANSLVHRDWNSRACIAISLDGKGITVTSPGGLPSGMGEREFFQGGLSTPRNEILARLFLRIRYIERLGTGIPRIFQSYENEIVKPEFDISENSVRVLLPVCKDADSLMSAEELAVYRAIKTIGSATRVDIERETGLEKTKVWRVTSALIENGLVEKEGTTKGSRYKIK